MPNWLSIVILLVVVVAIALLRDTWRQRGVDAFVTSAGLRRVTSEETAWQATAAPLVALMHPSGARIWGTAVTGILDDAPVTIAEHESSGGVNQASRWYTVVVWPLRKKGEGSLVLRSGSHPQDGRGAAPSQFAVHGEPSIREKWLTEARVTAIDRLPTDASYVLDVEYGAWRLDGTLSRALLERISTEFPTVRHTLDAA